MNPDRAFAPASVDTPPEAAFAAAAPQGPSIAQIHPRTMIALDVTLGQTDVEVNSGDVSTGIISASSDAYEVRLKAEHFWESELGAYFNGTIGSADEIDGPGTSLDSGGGFLALSYRATMSDTFRMPVRFGPFLHTSDLEGSVGGVPTTITRDLIGVRLSAEPEYIIFQRDAGGKLSEMTVFAEINCGAGPTSTESGTLDEDGYAFTLGWELGVRYKMPMGLLAGLSFLSRKIHYGATESYNSGVFFGVDEDFMGVSITAGARF